MRLMKCNGFKGLKLNLLLSFEYHLSGTYDAVLKSLSRQFQHRLQLESHKSLLINKP